MNRNGHIMLGVLTALVCLNFGSSQDTSVAGNEKPKIDFYGSLTDTTGNTYKVENISISGMYKQIPVYQKPALQEQDPSINITKLDFVEIYSIKVPNQQEILSFKNREYIEIEITSRDPERTKQRYIIEKNKRILCDQINAGGLIEKDLSFEALDTLLIDGYRQPKNDDSATKDKDAALKKETSVEHKK